MSSNGSAKDTIYIDVDDEITAVIDKVRASKHKIVALVLPKRATVFQSIVNMKLLKRTSDEEKKNVVLISSEAGLMPLAGAVGLHMAKTLQSKPEIPAPPEMNPSTVESVEDEAAEVDTSRSIGELAGIPPEEEEEAIEVDNADKADEPEKDSKKTPKQKKNKKLKIPNFNKFRLKLFAAGAGVVLLIVGWVFAFVVMPKATVTIQTDTTTLTSSLTPKVNAAIKEFKPEEAVLPAEIKEVEKTETEKVAATGQKDIGNKASGTMNLTNCINDGRSHTIPAGTSFSRNNFTFVTSAEVTLDIAVFSGSNCRSDDFGLDKDVPVVASAAGVGYNLEAGSYNSSISGIVASGTAMTGGTTQVVKVVSQQDVDSARDRLAGVASTGAQDELKLALEQSELFPLLESVETSTPSVKSTPNVGDEAAEVTVSSTTVYKMVGIKKEYLQKLIEEDAKKQIDTVKQSILDDGFEEAVFKIIDRKSTGEFTLSMQSTVTAGPEINQDELKQQIIGKKKGEAQAMILGLPGVKDVTITYSPFWIYSTPKKTGKITIIIQEVNQPAEANDNSE